MKLVGAGGQSVSHYLFNFDGVTINGSLLVVPRSPSRSHLFFANLSSSATMYVEIGYGPAVATISGGAVTGVSGYNAGFGYTKPPMVRFFGGGYPQGASGRASGPNTSYVGLAHPDQASSPQHPALATTTISGGAITGVTITDPGAGYIVAPYVQIVGSDLDPIGCAAPSATYGIPIAPGGSLYYNGTVCPTEPVAVYCGTASQNFTCRIMT